MLVALASSAAGGGLLAAAVSMEVPLAAPAPRGEHIVEALALFAQSNYVTGYPNEDVRLVGCHYYCRVAGSKSYYSFFVLYILNGC